MFTSLPTPADVEKVGTGEDGLVSGFRKGAAWFDLSTNAVDVVRTLHAQLAEKGVAFLDAPVSGGPSGANSGRLAIWVGGDKAVFDKYKAVLDAMGDAARYIGPIGAGSIAKLVHNAAGAAVNIVLSEVFTMGVKAGVEPLPLWEAIRQGAGGRARLFDRMSRDFLTGIYDPPDFALRLLHKDVSLACQLAREVSVPMRLTNLAHQELTEALNRGWAQRDSPRQHAAAAGAGRDRPDRGGTGQAQGGAGRGQVRNETMQLGALIPLGDIGGDPSVVRDYAQAVEAMGYDFLEAPDHVLGVNAASRADWDMSRNTSHDLFHDPFVLFGFLAGCTTKLGFSTGVLILPQRQTVLVAKQAACLDVLCGGRFRLGIGVGWNEVEFIGLNENFHNRGRRSEEQVQVMQALWAQDHVTFKGRYHTIDDAGINPRPPSGRVPVWFGGHHERRCRASPSGATAGCRTPIRRIRRRSRCSTSCAR